MVSHLTFASWRHQGRYIVLEQEDNSSRWGWYVVTMFIPANICFATVWPEETESGIRAPPSVYYEAQTHADKHKRRHEGEGGTKIREVVSSDGSSF